MFDVHVGKDAALWTGIAFWDRSGDERGNSNSAFLVDGPRTFEEVVVASRQAFPRVWERMKFDVVDIAERQRGQSGGRL